MRCTRCGTENPTDSEYCYQCGHKVGFDVVREEEYERKSSNPIITPQPKLSSYLVTSFLFPFAGFVAAYLLFRRIPDLDDIELEEKYRRTAIVCSILAVFNIALILIFLAFPQMIII
jgi:uncharacterized membrane protein YvbJ